MSISFEYKDIMEEVQEYMKSQEKEIGSGNEKKAPSGAIPSPWMFLPQAPKDSYNEVYPGILLGN